MIDLKSLTSRLDTTGPVIESEVLNIRASALAARPSMSPDTAAATAHHARTTGGRYNTAEPSERTIMMRQAWIDDHYYPDYKDALHFLKKIPVRMFIIADYEHHNHLRVAAQYQKRHGRLFRSESFVHNNARYIKLTRIE